jgi:hypothetical protein
MMEMNIEIFDFYGVETARTYWRCSASAHLGIDVNGEEQLWCEGSNPIHKLNQLNQMIAVNGLLNQEKYMYQT